MSTPPYSPISYSWSPHYSPISYSWSSDPPSSWFDEALSPFLNPPLTDQEQTTDPPVVDVSDQAIDSEETESDVPIPITPVPTKKKKINRKRKNDVPLPEGWTIEYRVRKRGRSAGRGYKVTKMMHVSPVISPPVSPNTEALFEEMLSKDESTDVPMSENDVVGPPLTPNTEAFFNDMLLNYESDITPTDVPMSENEAHVVAPSKKRRRMSDEEMNKKPEWLPNNWEMLAKRRSNGLNIDKTYTEPVSKTKLRSKKEVMTFQQTGKKPNKSKKDSATTSQRPASRKRGPKRKRSDATAA